MLEYFYNLGHRPDIKDHKGKEKFSDSDKENTLFLKKIYKLVFVN